MVVASAARRTACGARHVAGRRVALIVRGAHVLRSVKDALARNVPVAQKSVNRAAQIRAHVRKSSR